MKRLGLVVLILSIAYSGLVMAEPWTKHQIYRKSRLCNGLNPADFNQDGLTDYVTNFEDTGTIIVVLHPGPEHAKGTWPSVVVGQFQRVESSCAGDLDGDGWLDVAVAHGHEGDDEKAGVTVVWNPGEGKRISSGSAWKKSAFIPGSVELGNYLFIRSADINGDGAMDLVAGGRQALHATPAYDNPDPNVPSVGVIWLEAPAQHESRRDMTKWEVHDIDSDIVSGHGFSLGDIDGDGDLDVALANADWGTLENEKYVIWYENPGHDSPNLRTQWPRYILYQSRDFYTKPGVCIGDIDNDGHADILSQLNNRILFFRNKGVRPVRFQRIDIPKPSYADWRSRPIAIADLNMDGRKEIISGLIHHDGHFPSDKAAIIVMYYFTDPVNAKHWRCRVIKWSDGFPGKGRFDGEKWDNFFFDDVDRDGDLDIVANCEEYEKLGVEWFENPGGLKLANIFYGDVMPMTFPAHSEGRPVEVRQVCDRVYLAAQKQAHHLLDLVHPWEKDKTLLLLTNSKSREHWIRPNTGTVAGLAFLYRFGKYDESSMGVSRKTLLNDYIVPMMRYLIATHKTGTKATSDGERWGDAWQSAHWAHMLGRGSWWIWTDLPKDVRVGVEGVVAYEADRFVVKEPPYQIEIDTKAEENAWNSQILSVAILLMPKDPRRPTWEKAFLRWALSSFLRPADKHSTALLDGITVSDFYTGANMYDDFTLENHGIVHPGYMSTWSLSLGNALDFSMTGRKVPQILLYNVSGIYNNLKWFSLPDGGFVYPSGQDWALFRTPYWLFPHSLMTVYGNDPDAWTLAQRCLNVIEKMQARSKTGAIFHSEEYFFPSTQTDTLYSLAKTWLAFHQLGDLRSQHQSPRGVLRLNAGKILLNRTGQAIHTFSWGKKVMAQFVLNREDRIVSPDLRNGVGHIRLHGDEKPLPVRIHEITIQETKDRFDVDLLLDHGQNKIRAFLQYRSEPNGTFHIRENLVALETVQVSEIATGLVGILNNPYWIFEKGRRTIVLDEQSYVFESCRGREVLKEGIKEIEIDDSILIKSDKPLYIGYSSATAAQRGRATDMLYLNYHPEEKAYQNGDVISEYSVKMTVKPPS